MHIYRRVQTIKNVYTMFQKHYAVSFKARWTLFVYSNIMACVEMKFNIFQGQYLKKIDGLFATIVKMSYFLVC